MESEAKRVSDLPAEFASAEKVGKPASVPMPVDARPQLQSLLPQLSAALALGLGLAYLVGWLKLVGYFHGLGADWALHLLTPYRLLHESGDLVVFCLAVVACAVFFIKEKVLPPQAISNIAFGLMVVAGVGIYSSHRWGAARPGIYFWVSQLSLYCLVTATLFQAVSESLRLKGWRSRARGRKLGAVLIAGAIGSMGITLLWAPITAGSTKAKHDLNAVTSRLPTVLLKDAPSGPRWLMVLAFDGQLLVMQGETEQHERRFKLVAQAEVNAIHAVRSGVSR